MDVGEVVRMLNSVQRQRETVQKSMLSNAVKAKLIAALDDRIGELEAELGSQGLQTAIPGSTTASKPVK